MIFSSTVSGVKSPLPNANDQKLGAAERHVTVAFVDIVGYARLTTSIQPAANIIELPNRFFAIVVEKVDAAKGVLYHVLCGRVLPPHPGLAGDHPDRSDMNQ
ncbi:hypothetical protein DIJ64_10035 [Mycobacterium leprae]|uniref:Guanylate cyclase domain-containing protein n=1 Tax=Mycobacterium leprae TaxID=1769 RepID=A0AAD2PSQ6_MYCLR|nr:hypothetical protein DIJ64_10035 [Mycobacterium leprae]